MKNTIFEAGLNRALLETLDSLRFTSVKCGHPLLWSNADARMLHAIMDAGATSREVVLAKLHDVLVKLGHENVRLHLDGCYAPDHVPFPAAFAYVLGKDLVNNADRARIRFDHGQTTASYLEENFRDDLPDGALVMLLCLDDEAPRTHTVDECLCS